MDEWTEIGEGPGSGEKLYERQLQKGSLIAVVFVDEQKMYTDYITRAVIYVPPHD